MPLFRLGSLDFMILRTSMVGMALHKIIVSFVSFKRHLRWLDLHRKFLRRQRAWGLKIAFPEYLTPPSFRNIGRSCVQTSRISDTLAHSNLSSTRGIILVGSLVGRPEDRRSEVQPIRQQGTQCYCSHRFCALTYPKMCIVQNKHSQMYDGK